MRNERTVLQEQGKRVWIYFTGRDFMVDIFIDVFSRLLLSCFYWIDGCKVMLEVRPVIFLKAFLFLCEFSLTRRL